MVRVLCPTCRAVLDFAEDAQGQVCRCRCCRRDLRVPVLRPPGDAELGPEPAGARRRRRRRRRAAHAVGPVRYYLGGLGAFGWVLAVLFAVWLGSVVLALLRPGLTWPLLLAGNGLMVVGYLWVGLIAFRDNLTYGMLCFFTCLFTYVYIFMNLEETWRPAALMVLGGLFVAAGMVVP